MPLPFSKLVVASGNPGKLRELALLLDPLGIELEPQSALGVPEAEEPHVTFVENALAKARNAARHTGLPALADDSGILVDALGGAPGANSARYAGEPRSDERNNRKLIAALQGKAERAAHYVCVIVVVRHTLDPTPLIAEGEWHGEIVSEPRGHGGFGYDPCFLLPESGLTAAQLPLEQKNRLSHRARALAALIERLRSL
ncbi:MAG: RdgB/HAM1 family non-canonical purine NTP pyrophosphatase [Burkholderiales bacterium]|nr:RdgB/HAM1 family non-canonical purine NTP pyrophosphatase [Burkholderiales bacterium]